MNPKYPIYIPSKGRSESRLTAKVLDKMQVPYYIVIEESEYSLYNQYIPKDRILVLPFSDFGCVIPARNWIWQHAIDHNHKRHWQIDDNIYDFFRMNHNEMHPVRTGAIFRCAEDFIDRYDNVVLAGFHYSFFHPRTEKKPPYYLNTRIYSCTLIDNNLKHRFRGIYNEDTDLSLRCLKDGYCTVLFNCFLIKKAETMTVKGGNYDELYSDNDGRLKMAQSLQEQHPDVTTITYKWGKWQHSVNYKPFIKNKLIRNKNIKPGINNYGMILVDNPIK